MYGQVHGASESRGSFLFFIKISPFRGIGYARETPQSRERDEKKSPYTRRTLIRSGSRNRRRPGECRGQNGRTPAMRRLFAKRAHCKWHNIAPPERRRIGSTCARVPKVSSRNRGCPFRGYGCGGNPQEGGEIFIIKERGVFYLIWEYFTPSFPSGIPPPFGIKGTSPKMRDLRYIPIESLFLAPT